MERVEGKGERGRGWPIVVPPLLSVGVLFLLEQVVFGGPVVRFDHAARGWVHREPLPVIGPVAQVVADLANPPLVIAVMLLVVAVLAVRRRSWQPVVLGATAAVLLTVVVFVIKHLVARVGPTGMAPAWPSGHTTTAVVACGVVAQLFLARCRRVAIVLAVLLPLSVGVAMVLRDYHWVSDVVAAWLLGPLVLMAAGAATLRPPTEPQTAGYSLQSSSNSDK